jgi:hypothetical protein
MSEKRAGGGGTPKRGPEPDRLVIEEGWEEAVKKAIKAPRPPGGWPRPPAKKRGKKKAAPPDAS